MIASQAADGANPAVRVAGAPSGAVVAAQGATSIADLVVVTDCGRKQRMNHGVWKQRRASAQQESPARAVLPEFMTLQRYFALTAQRTHTHTHTVENTAIRVRAY